MNAGKCGLGRWSSRLGFPFSDSNMLPDSFKPFGFEFTELDAVSTFASHGGMIFVKQGGW